MAEINPDGPATVLATPSQAPLATISLWRKRRLVFLRAMGLAMLLVGMWEWGWMLGAYGMDGKAFLDVRAPVRNAIAVFAVIDLVAAIGLWLGATWGPVIWIVDTVAGIVLHTVYADVHGSAPLSVTLWGLAIVAFIVLTVLMRIEEHNAGEAQRRQRRESRAVR